MLRNIANSGTFRMRIFRRITLLQKRRRENILKFTVCDKHKSIYPRAAVAIGEWLLNFKYVNEVILKTGNVTDDSKKPNYKFDGRMMVDDEL